VQFEVWASGQPTSCHCKVGTHFETIRTRQIPSVSLAV
jgi:hypothetical protein